MYKFRVFLKPYKIIKKFPLYSKIYNKSLKSKIEPEVIKLVKKKSNEILKKNEFKYLLKNFDKKYILLHFYYFFFERIHFKVSANKINKILKIDKKFNIFSYDIVDISYCLRALKKLITFFYYFIFKQNKQNNQKNKNYKVLVNYGLNSKIGSKQDILYSKSLLKSKKMGFLLEKKLFSLNKKEKKLLKNNCISSVENPELNSDIFVPTKISEKTKKCLNHYLLNFYKSPVLISYIIEFIISYEYNFQLFRFLGTKVYIDNGYDYTIASKRQALKNLNAKNFSIQVTYFDPAKYNFLMQANDVVFYWGKGTQENINLKDHFIEKLIKIDPTFFRHNKNNKFGKEKFTSKLKKNDKLITLFDTNLDEHCWISPETYNLILNNILLRVLNNNKINLILRLKFKDNIKYINLENLKIVQELKKQKRLIIFDTPYANNALIYKFSDLVISVGSLTITAEAIANKKESLCFCTDIVQKSFLYEINKINPTVFNNLNEFKKNLDKKLQFNFKKKKINNLNNYFFEKKKKDTDLINYILNYIK
tara:strand:+ start:588 stop:2195 length:1608 start_codon:yes stop_codon:yes gene_type:complete